MSPPRLPSSLLPRYIKSPLEIAKILDWKMRSGATVLNVNITRDYVDLAVSYHPVLNEPVQSLSPVPIHPSLTKRRKQQDTSSIAGYDNQDDDAVQHLENLVTKWNVCSLVVNWPVQKEGWCGAPCGMVLHTLEIISSTSNTVIGDKRPVCLWDKQHHFPSEDEWGRTTIYSKLSLPTSGNGNDNDIGNDGGSSGSGGGSGGGGGRSNGGNRKVDDKAIYFASVEKYVPQKETGAVDIWNDFCRSHWPDIYYYYHGRQEEQKTASAGLLPTHEKIQLYADASF